MRKTPYLSLGKGSIISTAASAVVCRFHAERCPPLSMRLSIKSEQKRVGGREEREDPGRLEQGERKNGRTGEIGGKPVLEIVSLQCQ